MSTFSTVLNGNSIMGRNREVKIFSLFIVFSCYLSEKCATGSISVNLVNNGPTLLGASITFFAKVINTDSKDNNISYIYEFNDDIGTKAKEIALDAYNFTTNISYYGHESGKHVMTLVVRYNDTHIKVAENKTNFLLTELIPGHIVMKQLGNLDNPIKYAVFSNAPVSFNLSVHDPEHFLNNKTFSYFWRINSSIIFRTKDFNYTFKDTGIQFITLTIWASPMQPSFPRVGIYSRKFKVLNPVKVDVNGTSVLKFGQLVRLNVTCTGSPPFRYCWKIYHPNETVPANFTCQGPVVTTVCQFPVIRYISKSGSYKFLVKISNDINSETFQREFSILDETNGKQLTTIIIPVVCSLLALTIIVWGIAYFVHTRNRYIVEVADFDFQFNSNDLTFRTFFQRLGDSIIGTISCGRSRSIDDLQQVINSSNSYGSMSSK